MRKGIQILLLILCGTFFPAAYSEDAPASADVRCLIVGMRIAELADKSQSAAGDMLAYYYYGRLYQMTQQMLSEALKKEITKMTASDFKYETLRCGAVLVEKGKLMEQISKYLKEKAND